MTNSLDYRQYFENEFKHIRTELGYIKEAVDRTNSRVTHLEDDFEKEKEKMEKAIAYGNHVIDSRVTECPNIKRFEKLEGKMEGLEGKLGRCYVLYPAPESIYGNNCYFLFWLHFHTLPDSP